MKIYGVYHLGLSDGRRHHDTFWKCWQYLQLRFGGRNLKKQIKQGKINFHTGKQGCTFKAMLIEYVLRSLNNLMDKCSVTHQLSR